MADGERNKQETTEDSSCADTVRPDLDAVVKRVATELRSWHMYDDGGIECESDHWRNWENDARAVIKITGKWERERIATYLDSIHHSATAQLVRALPAPETDNGK